MMSEIDLNKFVYTPKDFEGIDVFGEYMEKAVKLIASKNEKTAEQVVIVKQQSAIKQLKQRELELMAQVEVLVRALCDFKNQYPLSPWIESQVNEALNKSSKQSLAEHDAASADKFARHLIAKHAIPDNGAITVDHIVEYVDEYVSQLRQRAGKG